MFTGHSFRAVNLFIYGSCISRFNQHPNKNIWEKKSRKFQKAKLEFGDFFGDPVVKILHYHSRRSRFDTWSRN